MKVSDHLFARLLLAYYRDMVLKQMLLPDIRHVSGTQFFVFQQDSAPAHRAKETVALITTETLDFIPPTLWLPNSPDLNPVDYCVWNVLQECVYRTKVDNVVDLKQRIVAEWAAIIASSCRPLLSGVYDCMLVFALLVKILSIVCSDIIHSSCNKY